MKIRLFVKPPQKPSILLEVVVSEGVASAPAQLKCFSPPPDNQAEQAEFGKTRAWAVEVPVEEVTELVDLTKEIRVVPFVDTRPKGYGSPVEVVISDGQAEAKLSWWLSPPAGWTALDTLVGRIVEISQRGGSALPVELEPPDDDDEDDLPPPVKKKGFFGKLIGG
jgi:hypothetical protein